MGSMGILKAWRRSSHLGTGASLVRTGTTIDDADANTELMPRREECSPARDKGGSRIRGFEGSRSSGSRQTVAGRRLILCHCPCLAFVAVDFRDLDLVG